MGKPEDSIVSVAHAACELKVSPQTTRAMIRRGDLEGIRIGRSWAVRRSSLEQVVARNGVRVAPATRNERGGELRVLSFFTGAMGLDLGLEQAGMRTVLACEFDKWSRATIESNRPDLPLLGDIRLHTARSVREAAGLASDDAVDVVAGGPPCQAFSTAGARRGFGDDRGNVFLHFIELALDLAPRYLVVENVRGLLSAPMRHRPHGLRGEGYPPLEQDELPGGALAFVLAMIRARGYDIDFDLYNSANFGTPQTRERVVMICTRDRSGPPKLIPTHSDNDVWGLPPWRTFKHAVKGLRERDQEFVVFPESRLAYYRMLGPGEYWKHLPVDAQKAALGNSYYSGGGKTGFLRRLAWDRPSPTLVTYPAMPATDLAHPERDRPLSVQEYMRLQEFPDDWKIQGSIRDRYRQIGNAVPIGMGRAVGTAIVAHSSGQTERPPSQFRYSRYRGTTIQDWEESFALRSRKTAHRGAVETLF
jgi:DNA (cytosine-5)-methyltransferase 1